MGFTLIPFDIRELDIRDGDEKDLGRYLNPFFVDRDILVSPVRSANGRVRWRNAVFASVRRIVADEGHHALSVKSLARLVNSTPQTIYNNIGTRDQIIAQSILEYKKRWLDSKYVKSSGFNIFGQIVLARYLQTICYPDFSTKVIRCMQENDTLMGSASKIFLRSVLPFARQGAKGRDEVHHTALLAKLLKEVTRVTAYDWVSGECSAQEMLADDLVGAEWCLSGANASRGKPKLGLMLEENIDRHMARANR